jgi:lipid-binding SYLF domain-containing protein
MIRPLSSPASFLVFLAMIGCATAPASDQGKSDIESRAASAITKAESNDATLDKMLRESVAYATFPKINKGAVGVGGAYGKGVLNEGGRVVGYCDMTQGSIGLQLGGQSYTEIIVFSTREALDRFKTGNFAFDAQATAVAVKSGTAANASYSHGVAVFTTDEAGLMFEASVGGQKFSYQVK